MSSPRVKLVTAFGIVYVVWGSTYLAIHYAIETIPPLLMAGARFLTAGSILYLWYAVRGGETPTALQWRNTAIVGTMLLLGGTGAVVWAELTVPSGTAALLVAVVPLWLVVLDWIRPGGERPVAGVVLGVVAGLVGMAVLVGPDSLHGNGPVNLRGAIVLFLGSLSWAAGSLFARRAELARSQVATSAMEMLAGGVGCVIVGLAMGEGSTLHLAGISRESLAGFLYLILFGSIVAYSAFSWMVQHADPAAVGTYAYVNPIIAVFLGWLIAGERVTPRVILGAAIIVAAVGIITLMSSRQRPEELPAPRRTA